MRSNTGYNDIFFFFVSELYRGKEKKEEKNDNTIRKFEIRKRIGSLFWLVYDTYIRV